MYRRTEAEKYLAMVNSSPPWEKANVLINGVEWVPGSSGVMYPDQTNKIEVEIPEASLQTLRFEVVNHGDLKPDADPAWGVDIERDAGKFTSRVTFPGGSPGAITLLIYSRDVVTVLEVPCEVKKSEPSFRFWYESTGQDAPLPPEVVNIRVNGWSGVNLRLKRSDGTPLNNVRVTLYRPEKEPFKRITSGQGIVQGDVFLYTTTGPRTFEAVAELPDGDLSVKLLINVREWPWP